MSGRSVWVAAGSVTVALAGVGVALGVTAGGQDPQHGGKGSPHAERKPSHSATSTPGARGTEGSGRTAKKRSKGSAKPSRDGRGTGDGARQKSQSGGTGSGVRVKVMTWNVCANTTPYRDAKGQLLCASGGRTDKVAPGIRWHMNRQKGLNAVLLQEICYADVQKLRSLDGMQDWKFRFVGSKDRGTGATQGSFADRRCGSGRGAFGVAVGVKDLAAKATYVPFSLKNVPSARDSWNHWNVQEAAVCLDGLGTRFCATHLTPWKGGHKWSDEAASQFLAAQRSEVEELASLGSGHRRVVLGGDLNASPTQSSTRTGRMLDPMYDRYKECSQDAAAGARRGQSTYQLPSGERGRKFDHIFTSRTAKASCSVPDAHVTLSDHLPLTATITF